MTRYVHRREIITGGGRDPDVVPELLDYQDTGCRLHPRCLSCPFAQCYFELPSGSRQLLSQVRVALMRQAFEAGDPIAVIAARFDVTERTVYRAIGGIRQARPERRRAG